MFLRCTQRKKDGKLHRYWSIVENRRCTGGKVLQRPVLYLGEVNDSQHAAWCRVIEGFDEDRGAPQPLALFASDREIPSHALDCGVGVRLKDLTSTYFESNPPFPEGDKRQFGYSRDKRSDCVQVVIALIVTPEGFPLAYEVLPGNTSDKTTLRGFLDKIQTQYGKAERIWVMD